MTKFLSKVEAIHPRGRQAKTGIKKPKAGFSTSKGTSIKEHLDWIASSVHDLIADYNFNPKTNRLLNEVASLHGFVTDSMGSEAQMLSYLKLAGLAGTLGKEIKRLYAKGALPVEVDRDMVHELLDVIADVEKKRPKLEEAKRFLDAAKAQLETLGF